MSRTQLLSQDDDVEKADVFDRVQSFGTPSHHSSFIDNAHVDQYFVGPRDTARHSKFPTFMRLHGSVLPRMILPLVFVGVWSGIVTTIHMLACDISLDSILITVLGLLVAFGTNLRCTTAYERYNDGRKYWAQLLLCSRNVGRMIWLNIDEKDDDEKNLSAKEILLGKISAINLLSTFSIALKHRLRFEPAVNYADLRGSIVHLEGITAHDVEQSKLQSGPLPKSQKLGAWLGISFLRPNPRRLLKRTQENLGNVPNEILLHLSAYINKTIKDELFGPFPVQGLCVTNIAAMTEVLSGCERILNTPLPLAYQICIAQIAWAYILLLPFQLVGRVMWKTIPITILAAYIILGLWCIGQELENPFGNDVNDLPLEQFCTEIAADLDTIMATSVKDYQKFEKDSRNRPMYPLYGANFDEWKERPEEEIRSALKTKVAKRNGMSSLYR